MSTRLLLVLAMALPACDSEGLLLESRTIDAGGEAGGPGVVSLGVRPARDLIDSMGLTVRLEDEASLQRAQEAFAELGVPHVRMFVPPPSSSAELERLAALGEGGPRVHLIVDPRFGAIPSVADLIASQPNLESVEGPNDFDAYDRDLSASELRSFMLQLRGGIDAAPRAIALVDALDSIGTGVGDLSAVVDYGNFERVRTRQLPGRDLSADETAARAVCGDRPLFVTECGYSNWTDDPQFVPEEVAARYIPRLFLAHFERGIVRTYLDELSDDEPVDSGAAAQGLLRGDGSKKPAYDSLRRFRALLGEPGIAGGPDALDLVIEPVAESLHLFALSRSDGKRLLLTWNEVPSVDPDTGVALSPAPLAAAFELPRTTTYAVYRPLVSDAPVESGASRRLELSVPDDVLVIELAP